MQYTRHMELLTRNDLAAELGMSRRALQALFDTGFVQNVINRGNRLLVTREEADRLASTPWAEIDTPLILVSVKGAVPDEQNGRRWQGWKAGIRADDRDQMDGIRQWWQVGDPDRYVGNLLVPTAAGFILAVYQVNGYSTLPGGLRSFEVEIARPEHTQRLLAHKVPIRQGGFTEPR